MRDREGGREGGKAVDVRVWEGLERRERGRVREEKFVGKGAVEKGYTKREYCFKSLIFLIRYFGSYVFFHVKCFFFLD